MSDTSYKVYDSEGNVIGGGKFYIGLTEYGVVQYPQHMEGCRYFRIEYGGWNENQLAETNIWLPPDADTDAVEKFLRDIWRDWEADSD